MTANHPEDLVARLTARASSANGNGRPAGGYWPDDAELDRQAADAITSLVGERDALKEKQRSEISAGIDRVYDNQKQAAARFGFEPGGLQWAWRTGQRTDLAELEWAIVDALAMGGVGSHPGDGVGCAAQIVTYQMRRAELAESTIRNRDETIAAQAAALDALDQLLDDMGDDGLCVCQAAKDQAIEAARALASPHQEGTGT